MARKSKGTELSVFKGREAKLNRAIFRILASCGPQTIYSIYKKIGTLRSLKRIRYSSVNKRVRLLELSGYIRKAGIKGTQAGFEASIYELDTKTYIAIMLDSIDLENILSQLYEPNALAVLGILIAAQSIRRR
jgi:hypothetical protein